MVLRVSVKGQPTRLVDFGPGHADPVLVWRNQAKLARLTIDEAIVHAADRHRPLRVTR